MVTFYREADVLGVLEIGAAAIGCIDALEIETAATLARLISIAFDLAPFTFVTTPVSVTLDTHEATDEHAMRWICSDCALLVVAPGRHLRSFSCLLRFQPHQATQP